MRGTETAAQVRARTDAAEPASPLLVVLAPPFWGSTALESLLASSPAVATLCGAGTWQCEPRSCSSGPASFQSSQRWWPPTEPLAYWSAAFGALESHWDHATRPIRLVKAPPDLAKVESLLAYFGARAIPYRFVALTQHPCLLTESHRKHELLNISAYYLHTAVRGTPPPNLFVLDYERLLADVEGAAQELADWLPALRELDLRKGLDLKSGGDRELSVAEYVESASCARRPARQRAPLHRGRRGGGGARRLPPPPPPAAAAGHASAEASPPPPPPPPPPPAVRASIRSPPTPRSAHAAPAAPHVEASPRPSAWPLGVGRRDEMRRVARLLRLVLPLVGCALICAGLVSAAMRARTRSVRERRGRRLPVDDQQEPAVEGETEL